MKGDFSQQEVLAIDDLHIRIRSRRGTIYAVNGIEFRIRKNEVFGLVGESGCGKSVTALSLTGLLPANFEVSGSIYFEARDVLSMSAEELRNLRRNKIAMIFQDPSVYLNPVLTIGDQLTEVLDGSEQNGRVSDLLGWVGLPNPEVILKSYAHQLSGGMSQRVVIAMALLRNPTLLVADEITTALDVTIQAQILNLLGKIRKEYGPSILFITHDLGLVAQFCDRVAVMYSGTIVEEADVTSLFDNPQHPYTQGLLKAVPRIDSRGELLGIPGSVVDQKEPINNCPFSSRCSFVWDRCLKDRPPKYRTQGQHSVACYLCENGGKAR